jgi:hypothetical protein
MFWPFNLKLGAQLTTYAGIALAATAALAWVREDAKRDALAEVQAEFQVQTAELKTQLAVKESKLKLLQNVLETTEKEAARLQSESKVVLEKQRETIPLSESCDKCRIPNERLWLRGKAAPTSVKGSSGS